jgi:hypothetical protein
MCAIQKFLWCHHRPAPQHFSYPNGRETTESCYGILGREPSFRCGQQRINRIKREAFRFFLVYCIENVKQALMHSSLCLHYKAKKRQGHAPSLLLQRHYSSIQNGNEPSVVRTMPSRNPSSHLVATGPRTPRGQATNDNRTLPGARNVRRKHPLGSKSISAPSTRR